jgi:hypothetical protein
VSASAIITLAALQSPLVPGNHGMTTFGWLIPLLALRGHRPLEVAAFVALWLLLRDPPSALPAGGGLLLFGIGAQVVAHAALAVALRVARSRR